jgi:hypothetical protein
VWLLQDQTIRIYLCSVLRLLVVAHIVPSTPIPITVMMEAICYFETSVLTKAIEHNIPENGILHRKLLINPLMHFMNLNGFLIIVQLNENSLGFDTYCHVYRVCVCGSVTINNTWIRIGYRIYSL